MDKFKLTLEELKLKFSEFEKINAVFVYGSVAREDYSERHSDLDLLIFLDKRNKNLEGGISKLLMGVGIKYNVRVHIEYLSKDIKEEDKSLIKKILEEGKLLYSDGLLIISNKKIGLNPYYLCVYKIKDRNKQVKLSQILHGRKSWYYKGKEKIVKEYKGIIDNEKIIEAGRGALLISLDKKKDINLLFENLDIKYNIKKLVFI